VLDSPVFSGLILSEDGSTTALLLNLKDDPELSELHRQRSQLRLLKQKSEIDSAQISELANVEQAYDTARGRLAQRRHSPYTGHHGIL